MSPIEASIVTRRAVLGGALVAGAAALAGCSDSSSAKTTGATSHETSAEAAAETTVGPASVEPGDEDDRAIATYNTRVTAAAARRDEATPHHPNNGDVERQPPGSYAYSKGLPHGDDGLPDPLVWTSLRSAVAANDFAAIEELPPGGTRRLVNPLAAFATPLIGLDPSQLSLEPPPAVGSDEFAAELVELYWMALARDVSFSRWGSDATVAAAAAELQQHPLYDGRDVDGQVTPSTVFRGPTDHDQSGPYISQFLWLRVLGGALPVDQKVRAYLPGFDFLATPQDWLRSQRGIPSQQSSPSTPRFVHTLRDLASYVHGDYAYQLPLNAALILLANDDANDAVGITVPYSKTNPYLHSSIQGPFATLCQPQILELVGLAAGMALRAAWFQKWLVHYRMRPEEAAARLDAQRTTGLDSPLSRILLEAPVLERIAELQGNALLSSAYADGSPLHPSYPSGHATIGGACCTILKACFDEQHEIDPPVVATEDGLGLEPYLGGPLRVGAELDKLASNIAIGRNAAGIHYRSDADGGKRLGEAVAIAILRDIRMTLPEPFSGFTFTTFDGQRIDI